MAANPGSNEARPGEGGGAAVDLLQQPVLVEDLEVAPDGHVGDAELARKLGDADRAGLADPVEDERLALAGEHRTPLPVPRAGRRRAATAGRRGGPRRACILIPMRVEVNEVAQKCVVRM